MALAGPFLSGALPLVWWDGQKIHFPLLKYRFFQWGVGSPFPLQEFQQEFPSPDSWAIWPPNRFEPLQPDFLHILRPPLTPSDHGRMHLLGTDALGRDVLAQLLHGAFVSLSIAFSAMLLSLLVGTLLGGMAGFFGDHGFRMRLFTALLLPFLGVLLWFVIVDANELLFYSDVSGIKHPFFLKLGAWSVGLVLICLFGYSLQSVGRWVPWLRRQISVPLDTLVVKLMEGLTAFPRLLLIVALMSGIEPGWTSVVVLLGLLSWPPLARLWRAGLLQAKTSDYAMAARALGFHETRVIGRHLLPNVSGPLAVAVANGLASLIMAEAGLSFLGLGLPMDIMSWGRMLMSARQALEAWWLIVFPAGMIWAFVALCHATARRIEDAYLKESAPTEFNKNSGRS
ncbi:MAG: ABC transporter permease [Flavobacteriales bacterium]|nr:ABC transporter permease [Flavobacteriales bacterium]